MNKCAQIRTLLLEGKLNRAEIARKVQCSYQYVRNEESRVLSRTAFPAGTTEAFIRDPLTSDVYDLTVSLPKPSREFGLWEETPIKFK